MTGQHQRGRDNRHNNAVRKEDSINGNIKSLVNIIDDIMSRMNHQILGNCDVLCYMVDDSSDEDGDTLVVKVDANGNPISKPMRISAFQKERVDALVKNPIRLVLGRINGLKKVIAHLEEQVKSITVSTGKE